MQYKTLKYYETKLIDLEIIKAVKDIKINDDDWIVKQRDAYTKTEVK